MAEQNALLSKSAADQPPAGRGRQVGAEGPRRRVVRAAEALQAIKHASRAVAARGRPAAAPPSRRSGRAPAAGAPAPPGARRAAPAPRELYSQAYADYARGNYDLAMQGFTGVPADLPGTDFSDNAQYWIGECLYGKQKYAEAIEAWNTLFRDFPASDKLPDARFKKGMALERLGRRSQALVEYRYVVDRYPNSRRAARPGRSSTPVRPSTRGSTWRASTR